MAMKLLDGERDWLTQITSDLPNDLLKLVYADWLQENGDEKRAAFVRKYVEAAASLKAEDIPRPLVKWNLWSELIGVGLLRLVVECEMPEYRDRLRKLARPALRLAKKKGSDKSLPVGASKIGGDPDLPAKFAWPTGDTCRATYNLLTAGETRFAGFVAQINLMELADTQAARDLPRTGLLSFFCFQDWENDNPDKVGVRCVYFPEVKRFRRTPPPLALTGGNEAMPVQQLAFAETLDLPDLSGGPWSAEYGPPAPAYGTHEYEQLSEYHQENFENVLGYASSTTGSDPTPDKDHRHLIFLKSKGTEGLHIQIHRDDLKAANFDAIKLVWVDFD